MGDLARPMSAFCLPQVLQTGQEITELDGSGFATQVPTVFAGNVGRGKYILQVCVSPFQVDC